MEQSLRALEDVERLLGLTVKLSNGNEVHLPPGFQFSPTESQLLIHYLLPKTRNKQLPNYHVQEISNPFAIDPSQLSTGLWKEDDRYFFSKQSTSFDENYSTGRGWWILVDNKLVLAVDGHEEVEANRAKYLFIDNGYKFSGWKMFVYSLRPFNFISEAQEKNGGDNWVVIRIFHQPIETQLYFNYPEDEVHEEDDTEHVSSNIVEDATHRQTNTGDVTPTSSCISNGASTKGCSSRQRR